MFGFTTSVKNGEMMPARKEAGFMRNASEVARVLEVECDKSHQHETLVNGRAKAAQVYPAALCVAIRRGSATQLQMDEAGLVVLGSLELNDFEPGPNPDPTDMEEAAVEA